MKRENALTWFIDLLEDLCEDEIVLVRPDVEVLPRQLAVTPELERRESGGVEVFRLAHRVSREGIDARPR